MRRVAVAVAMSGVVFAGVPAAASVAAASAAAGRRVPVRAAAVKTVSYAGYRITVPAKWPVYRLDRDPGTCVRYDVSAVYLGTPGPSQRCPAHLAGRTQTVSITPAGVVYQRAGTGTVPEMPGGVRAGRLPAVGAELVQNAQQQVLGAALDGSVVSATYGGDPGMIRRVLASLHAVPRARARQVPVPRGRVARGRVARGRVLRREVPRRADVQRTEPRRTVAHRVPSRRPSPRVPLRGLSLHRLAARVVGVDRKKSVPEVPAARKSGGKAAVRPVPGNRPARDTAQAGHAAGPRRAAAPYWAAVPRHAAAQRHAAGQRHAVPAPPPPAGAVPGQQGTWPAQASAGVPSGGVSSKGAPSGGVPSAGVPQPVPGPAAPASAPMTGFDTCTAPSLAAMRAWRARYSVAGIYIGGVNMACDFGNLTPAWIQAAERMGWSLLPTYVGPQAPCYGAGTMIKPAKAKAEGFAEAATAAKDAASFGLGKGTPIYYDMEAYKGARSCSAAVVSFVAGWTRGLNAHGYVSGVYSSESSGVVDMQAAAASGWVSPQGIWIARWDGQANLTKGALAHISAWPANRRNKQFRGDHWQTVGGVKLEVDSDIVAGPVAGPAPSAPPQALPPPTLPSPGEWGSDGLPPDAWGPAGPPPDDWALGGLPSDDPGSSEVGSGSPPSYSPPSYSVPSDEWGPSGVVAPASPSGGVGSTMPSSDSLVPTASAGAGSAAVPGAVAASAGGLAPALPPSSSGAPASVSFAPDASPSSGEMRPADLSSADPQHPAASVLQRPRSAGSAGNGTATDARTTLLGPVGPGGIRAGAPLRDVICRRLWPRARGFRELRLDRCGLSGQRGPRLAAEVFQPDMS